MKELLQLSQRVSGGQYEKNKFKQNTLPALAMAGPVFMDDFICDIAYAVYYLYQFYVQGIFGDVVYEFSLTAIKLC